VFVYNFLSFWNLCMFDVPSTVRTLKFTLFLSTYLCLLSISTLILISFLLADCCELSGVLI